MSSASSIIPSNIHKDNKKSSIIKSAALKSEQNNNGINIINIKNRTNNDHHDHDDNNNENEMNDDNDVKKNGNKYNDDDYDYDDNDNDDDNENDDMNNQNDNNDNDADDDNDDDCDQMNNDYYDEECYDEEFYEETDPHSDDPEHFEYEHFDLNDIDLIQHKKYENVSTLMSSSNQNDIITLLIKNKWNLKRITQLYNKDKESFHRLYLSDNNNNTNNNNDNNNNTNELVNTTAERSRLTTFINIFKDTISCEINKLNEDLTTLSQSDNVYCRICCVNRNRMHRALPQCGHSFCTECWSMHFEHLVNIGSSSLNSFECMETKCKCIASKDFVLNCLKTSK
jgi:hypothetical protein